MKASGPLVKCRGVGGMPTIASTSSAAVGWLAASAARMCATCLALAARTRARRVRAGWAAVTPSPATAAQPGPLRNLHDRGMLQHVTPQGAEALERDVASAMLGQRLGVEEQRARLGLPVCPSVLDVQVQGDVAAALVGCQWGRRSPQRRNPCAPARRRVGRLRAGRVQSAFPDGWPLTPPRTDSSCLRLLRTTRQDRRTLIGTTERTA